jgi:hypothetical protein
MLAALVTLFLLRSEDRIATASPRAASRKTETI